jgi:hypothetical protein
LSRIPALAPSLRPEETELALDRLRSGAISGSGGVYIERAATRPVVVDGEPLTACLDVTRPKRLVAARTRVKQRPYIDEKERF